MRKKLKDMLDEAYRDGFRNFNAAIQPCLEKIGYDIQIVCNTSEDYRFYDCYKESKKEAEKMFKICRAEAEYQNLKNERLLKNLGM